LSTAIKSSRGVALAPSSWNFTTAWPSGTVTFSPAALLAFKEGTHTGYKFTSSGTMTAVKSYTLGGSSSAYTSRRQAISHRNRPPMTNGSVTSALDWMKK